MGKTYFFYFQKMKEPDQALSKYHVSVVTLG